MALETKTPYSSFAALSILMCILGTILNGLSLLTFKKNRSLLTAKDIILCSMCLSDFITSLTANPFVIYANLVEKWPFEDSGCKVYGFLTTLCGLASINHLAGIAFERYDAMVREPKGRSLFNEKKATHAYFVVFLWLYSLMFSVFPLANWSSYTLQGVGTSCSVDWSSSTPSAVSYTVILYVFCFVLPLGIIVFSYYKVLKTVRQMRFNANNIWGNLSATAEETLKTEKKMAALCLVMTVAFIIAWTPYAVVSLIAASGHKSMVGPLGASIPSYFAKTSSIYNSIIYVLLYKAFRQKMFALLPFCGRSLVSGNRVGKLPPRPVRTVAKNIPETHGEGTVGTAGATSRGVVTKLSSLTTESLELVSVG